MNRIPDFPPFFVEILNLARKAGNISPFWLGGSGGAGGGGGAPPGGFIGQLPQGQVTYDTTEAATTSGSGSLVDNLNHIRYQISGLSLSSGVGGSGVAGRVAYWTSGSVLSGSSALTWDTSGSTLSVRGLSVTSGSLLLAGSMFKLDAPIEIDTTGAINGQVLGYNGTKWVPAVSSGSQAGTTGSGTTGQFTLWSSSNVLFGVVGLEYVAGSTSKARFGRSGDTFALGLNSTPGDNVTVQVTQPSWAGGSDPSVLVLTPGTLTAQTGNPSTFLSQSLSSTWTNAFLPSNWAANIFSPPLLNAATAGGVIPLASTVRISGAPTSGSNLSISQAFALEVTSGSTYLGGPLSLSGKWLALDASIRLDPSGATNGQVLTYESSSGKWIAANSSGSGGFAVSGVGGSGANARMAYWTSGSVLSGDANFNWDTINQRLVVGGVPADVPIGVSAKMITVGENTNTGISQFEYGPTLPSFYVARANGTQASPSGLLFDEAIGGLNASGYGSTGWAISTRARLQARAAENWSDTSQGTYWSAYVTQPGGTTAIDALDIKYDRLTITGKDLVLDASIELDPTGAVTGQALAYNGSKWVPSSTAGAGISGLSGAGAASQVAYFTSGSVLTSDPFLFWDITTTPRRLVVGATSSVLSGPQIVVTSDTTSTGYGIEAYGVTPTLASIRANGNRTSPTSTLSGDIFLRYSARGYRSGGFASSSSGRIDIYATENWTSGSQGTDISFYTTGSGSATIVEALRLNAGQATLPTVSDTLYPALVFKRAEAGPGLVEGGQPLGTIDGIGFGDTIYSATAAARIALVVDDDWGDTYNPTDIDFYVTGYNSLATDKILSLQPGYVQIQSSIMGGDVLSLVLSNNSSQANSGANFEILTSGSAAGDPNLTFAVVGTVSTWSLGLDNSDGGSFKIDNDSATGGLTALKISASSLIPAWASASQVWSGQAIQFDAPMELDPSGATAGQILGFNGTKWVPTTGSGGAGGISGLSGLGSNTQVAYFTSGSVLTSSPNMTFDGNRLNLATSGSAGGLGIATALLSWTSGSTFSLKLGSNIYFSADTSGNITLGGHTLLPINYFSLDSTGRLAFKRDTTALVSPGSDYYFEGGAHTAVNNELIVADFRAGNTTTTSSVSSWRQFLFTPSTISGNSGTRTLTTAATLAITGAPSAGANAAITNPLALWVQGGNTLLAGGLGVGSITSGSTGQIWQSSNQQRWNSNIIQFDGAMEFDPTGATNGHYLAYNGTKWTLAVPGNLSSAGGGAQYRIALWNNSSTIGADAGFTWDGFTFKVDPSTSVVNGAFETFLVKPPTYTYSNYIAEPIDIDFDLRHTVTFPNFSSGSANTQRAMIIQPPTYGLSVTGMIYDAATLAITGAPVTSGSFITIVRDHALWVQSGEVLFAGGLDLGTASGATAGQLRQSAVTQIWGASTIKFDNSMELDSTGASPNQVLAYNGVKWIPQASSGSSGISGSGANTQIAFWSGTNSITGTPDITLHNPGGGLIFDIETINVYIDKALEIGGGLTVDVDSMSLGGSNLQLLGGAIIDSDIEIDASGSQEGNALLYENGIYGADTIAWSVINQYATATIANTNAETSLIGSARSSSFHLSRAGQAVRLNAWGVLSTLGIGAGTLTVNVKIGSTLIVSTGAVALATSLSGAVWHLESNIVCQTTGSSGAVLGQGELSINSALADIAEPLSNGTSTVTVNLVPTIALDLTATFSVASTSNSISTTNLSVEVIG